MFMKMFFLIRGDGTHISAVLNSKYEHVSYLPVCAHPQSVLSQGKLSAPMKRRRWSLVPEAFTGGDLATLNVLMSNLPNSAKIALPPQETSLTQVQDLEPWAVTASAIFK